MALIAALALSLTFVPAAVAVLVGARSRHKRIVIMRARGAATSRCWRRAALRFRVSDGALLLVVFCGSLAARMGSEFIPSLDEGDIAMHALRIPARA